MLLILEDKYFIFLCKAGFIEFLFNIRVPIRGEIGLIIYLCFFANFKIHKNEIQTNKYLIILSYILLIISFLNMFPYLFVRFFGLGLAH